MNSQRHLNATLVLGILMCSVCASRLFAQPSGPTYSVDAQSASVPGLIREHDILTPNAPGNFPPPSIVVPHPLLGIIPSPVAAELDALSYGTDPLLLNLPNYTQQWSFSVDEFAVGRPAAPGPSVTTEGATGAQQAAADIYLSTLPPGPLLPFAGVNAGLYDGDGGFTPFAAPGLNLREPNAPTINALDAGDNLDAWDLDQPLAPGVSGNPFSVPIYFSLDSSFLDPLDAPFNTSTAIANGVVSGDVLVATTGGGTPSVFANAFQLGLDQAGPDHDDLDALVLWENGNGSYDPTAGPYSWVGGVTDMLLFSVRRGSAVIGQPDSLLGLPIEEGDILVPMGNPGQLPGIFVPAEALGLATVRTNGTATFQLHGDDLDALDVQQVPEPAAVGWVLCGLLVMTSRRRRLRTSV